jgi:uncharacterized peroxidase-related enzyme
MPRLRSLPDEPVMRDLYRTHPGTCKPLGELTEAAMRGPSPFTQAQRELIAAYVSGLNACTYCHGTHAGVAEACGVAPDLITASLVDIETAPLEAKMKPLLRYAQKLTLSPAQVTEADAAAIYDAGWGDDALYSTVLVTALLNFCNGLLGRLIGARSRPADSVCGQWPDSSKPDQIKPSRTKESGLDSLGFLRPIRDFSMGCKRSVAKKI